MVGISAWKIFCCILRDARKLVVGRIYEYKCITCLKWVTLSRCDVRWCSTTNKRTTSNWTAASTGRSILWHRQHYSDFRWPKWFVRSFEGECVSANQWNRISNQLWPAHASINGSVRRWRVLWKNKNNSQCILVWVWVWVCVGFARLTGRMGFVQLTKNISLFAANAAAAVGDIEFSFPEAQNARTMKLGLAQNQDEIWNGKNGRINKIENCVGNSVRLFSNCFFKMMSDKSQFDQLIWNAATFRLYSPTASVSRSFNFR